MKWSLSKKEDELALLFHIGSSRVEGALFRKKKSGVPEIIFAVSEPITLGPKTDPEELLERTVRSLGSVAGRIHKAALGAPLRIHCVLASPWYVSQTRHITFRKNNSFVFTEKVADELIQKEIKLFSEEHAATYGRASSAVRPIELKNIKTLLNGYETSEPLFKKCRELEMIIFISMASVAALETMEKVIARHYGFREIKFSSFAVASFTILRDLDAATKNFLLVDAGGEVTDIFMVKGQVLSDSISFPLGRNFFIRGLAETFGIDLEEAASLLVLYKEGHAEESVRSRLEPIMQKLGNKWVANFQKSLADISGDIFVPSTIFVTAEENCADMFGGLIKTEQFSQYTLAESKFDVKPLDAEMLQTLAASSDGVVAPLPLIIDSVYISRFLATI